MLPCPLSFVLALALHLPSNFQPTFRLIHDPDVEDGSVADVFWITHAGGGTNTLAHRMRTLNVDVNARVHTPWMPMREELIDVQFDGSLVEMASLIAGQIEAERSKLEKPKPFAVVGHSFGSVLAYRVTCELVQRGLSPHRLVVLSFPAPDNLSHERQLHTLSDEMLVTEVDQMFGGIPENIREDKTALQFFVPGLRFDLGLLESYQHEPKILLEVPLVAICGADDRAVYVAEMHRWKHMTAGQFRLRSMPGDHFFPLARMPEILEIALWDISPG